jgi:hypothetical protein
MLTLAITVVDYSLEDVPHRPEKILVSVHFSNNTEEHILASREEIESPKALDAITEFALKRARLKSGQ